MKILVTGVAGFIGFHLSKKLLNIYYVYGIDNLNSYSNTRLKKDRISILKKNKNFKFYKLDLSNKKKINTIIKNAKIKYIIHLAAQAGVRDSIHRPEIYFRSNLEGFFNILEISKENNVKHLIFASTSSVYGENNKFPFKESFNTDKPLSFYAATKKSNEIMAYSYSNMFKLPCTAIRFFTVYGPFGRPDMALYKFTRSIFLKKEIKIFNHGKHVRDFTYIDDAIEGTISIIKKPSKKSIPFNIFNIGSGKPKKLLNFLKEIEKNFKFKAKIKNMPLQLGDVKKTHSDIQSLKKFSKFQPKTNIKDGIFKFINWYKEYYKK